VPGYPAPDSRGGQGRGPDLRWAARSKAARTSPNAALFPVVQGGSDPGAAAEQAQAMAALNFDGYAIGGLKRSGRPKELMPRTCLEATTPGSCSEISPGTSMGVRARPPDLVEAVAEGWIMFDCESASLATRVLNCRGITAWPSPAPARW